MSVESLAADQDARRLIRESLDETLLVEAAAGTGKTTELVTRIVNVLRAGKARVDELVAVTFTKKAAGELKLRLRQALDFARRDATAGERERLEAAIAHLEEARIGTIHAFCAEILRERPVEGRVDPRFEELDENEAKSLFDRAFARFMEVKLAELPPGLRRALSRKLEARDSRTAVEKLKASAWKLIEWRDFNRPWTRDPDFSREARLSALLSRAREVAEQSASATSPKDTLYRATAPVRMLVERVDRMRTRSRRDDDALEALFIALVADLEKDLRVGRGRYSPTLTREEMAAARDDLLASVRAFKASAEADLAAELQAELIPLAGDYDALKAASGHLDFVDLLVRVRDLLRDDTSVRGYLSERFRRIFVDEFQDTDPLQAEILLLLSADDPRENDWRRVRPVPGKLFLVGDPKQSIYRFRRADVVLYRAIKDALSSQGVRVLHLSRSFRATSAIQSAINAAFEGPLAEDITSGQPGYVPLLGGPEPLDGQPSVIALPVPEPFGLRNVSKDAIKRSLPRAIGAFVAWLVNESGFKVREGANGGTIPLAPRHIALLFRSYVSGGQDLTRPYSQALELHGVPHILVAGRSFHRREEVETIRAALTAIEWPDDTLSVYATLRGPLFALSDESLLAYRQRAGRIHPFGQRPELTEAEEDEDGLMAVVEALDILADLNRRRTERPIAETIGELLTTTRAYAGFALRASGDQALANVQRVIELARAFEMDGGLSFRGFVEQLKERAESDRSTEAPLLEEGAEGVRMMTVHSAKGLEFPVVILADMNANLSHRDADRFVDPETRLFATRLLDCMPRELSENQTIELARDRAEGVRVAYVAATRARDLLVVPAVGVEERESWYAPMNAAIYPTVEGRRERKPAAGCPPFSGDSSVLTGPYERSGVPDKGVAPGAHAPRRGHHTVVWWDPRCLDVERRGSYGLRDELLLHREGVAAEAESLEAYLDWRERRIATLAKGSERSMAPFSPTEAEAPPRTLVGAIEELSLPRPPGRPAGRRFGTLVHAVLRDIPFDAETAAIATLSTLHGRTLGATKAEVAASIAAVENALVHPLIARARAASRSHRELPILHQTPEGDLLDGTMDLCFFDEGAWTVIDFKTDVDVDARRKEYLKQMRWYLLALSRATGAPVRGVLLGL